MMQLNSDFAMANHTPGDVLLHQISRAALKLLFENIGINRIQNVLLTGSVANGEGTVLEFNSCITASDFDFVITFDLLNFFKYRKHLQTLSEELSDRLLRKGVSTHVVFLPNTRLLGIGSYFGKSPIYEYEFRFASKSVFGKNPYSKRMGRPTKRDALELTFTVISELTFLKFRKISKIEESYVLAKRALTLLNSTLIYFGIIATTYATRIEIAKKCFSQRGFPLNQTDISVLEHFTRYKLSSSLNDLMKTLGFTEIDSLIEFQTEFVRKMTTKVLCFEIMNFTRESSQINSLTNESYEKQIKQSISNLKQYLLNSKMQNSSRIVGITLYILEKLSRNKQREDYFKIFIFHKQSPKAILNALTALLFLSEDYSCVAEILRELFPWIKIDDVPLNSLFCLWQTAEQSIKLS